MSKLNPASKIKVYLLTGFLGAGKTTLLNHLLEVKKDEENSIIENEFGKISIDAQLLNSRHSSLFEMNNGCICCTLDNDLTDTLAKILSAEKKPTNLFIEASGVADPGSIVALFRIKEVEQFFQLKKVICLTDATVVEDWIEEIPEVSRQLAVADLILINKKSLVNPTYLQKLYRLLHSINKLAKVLVTDHARIPPQEIEEETFNWPDFTKDPETTIKSQHPLKSILFEVDKPFDRDLLLNQLTLVFFLSYHQLYRMKGLVWIKDSKQPYVVQTHGKQVHLAPYKGKSKIIYPKAQLVFIGKGIQRDSIERIIKKSMISF